MAKFTVDTHLFRELGELLVGRDSTALVELIKNAYDADATEVTVYGEQLDNPDVGLIRIEDNGIGMSQAEFEDGFLRVAARRKEHGDRRSPQFRRRYTGEKGIGRLAAHKLARQLHVESTPLQAAGHQSGGVDATINWDRIEELQTLDQVETSEAIEVTDLQPAPSGEPGTTITLSKLRRPWNAKELAHFLEEVQSFQAPAVLTEPIPDEIFPGAYRAERPLFGALDVQDIQAVDSAFSVNLAGAFEAGDSFFDVILSNTDWILEIDASIQRVNYKVVPTLRETKKHPDARRDSFSIEHPEPKLGPFFHSRILVREGAPRVPQGIRDIIRRTSGIRVYLARIIHEGEKHEGPCCV